MSEKVKRAIKLWLSLEHPKSFSEGRLMSYSLTRICCSMTLDEHVEYEKGIWTIVQERVVPLVGVSE
jgi:hypothetical protein